MTMSPADLLNDRAYLLTHYRPTYIEARRFRCSAGLLNDQFTSEKARRHRAS